MDRKDHAEQNEHACNYLFDSKKYPDWVVTTAFYSALHFVQHEMFPGEINGKTYNTFNKYYNQFFAGVANKPDKHSATVNLVKSEIGDPAHQNYEWLYDLCMTARYRNYQINPLIAEESLKRLNRIKSVLKK